MHVPRIVGIVAALAILSYANAETKGLITALVVVALFSLAVTHPSGIAALAKGPTAGLRKVIQPQAAGVAGGVIGGVVGVRP